MAGKSRGALGEACSASGLTNVAREVSGERVTADEAGLGRQSDASIRAIIDCALDCVITIDRSGCVLEFNPAAERVFGYTRAEAIGRELGELVIPPDLRARHHESFAHYLQTREARVLGRRVEMRAMRSDGSEFPIELSITEVNSSDNTAFAGYVRDISDQKRAELELRQSQELYRLVVENAKDLIGVVDLEGRILFVSPASEEALGLTSETLVGADYARFVHPDDLPLVRAAFEAAAAGDRHLLPAFRVTHANGKWIFLEGAISSVTDDDDNVTMFVAILRNLTERIEAEEQRERAEQAEREFVVNAAHELRTPLTGIAAAIEVLQAGAKEVPAARDAFLADLDREARRLSRLVHALLVLARVQVVSDTLQLERVGVRRLLRTVSDSLEAPIGVEVTVACPDRLMVVANRELLERSLTNLAANAVAHTTRGQISFSARRSDDGWVEIDVADTGSGLSAEECDRIFDRFYRGHSTATRGFGLGLAIVQQAIRALDGAVDVTSSPGDGTTVRVRLPGGNAT